VCARMTKVVIGVDPHKAAVAVAAKGSANGPGLPLRKARSDLGYSTEAMRTS
jgi:hypothetical protein